MAAHYGDKPHEYSNDIFGYIQRFLHMESAGGILFVIAATFALMIANSSLFEIYDYVLNGVKFEIGFAPVDGEGGINIKKSILLWINDGFMAIFFFLVGLEIKREVVSGELSSRSRAILPAIAAVGGMVVPALFYYYINMDHPENLNGWAIPAATDIAFALGILGLLGTRAPVSLKILLTAIAIIDDLGAILIIAFFYTSNLNFEPLYYAAAALFGLLMLNLRNNSNMAPYVLLGLLLWAAVLKSGVHATLAGVITALFIPMYCKRRPDFSPIKTLEHALHPWVAFGILPIFAFANAGVPFQGMGFHSLADPVTLGIIAGLVVGKQLGIFAALVLTIKLGLSPMPKGANWFHLYAVSALCGIGFTMSLFIGGLAFEGVEYQASVRLGVLVGSTISAITGFAIMYFAPPCNEKFPSGEVEPSDEKAELDAGKTA